MQYFHYTSCTKLREIIDSYSLKPFKDGYLEVSLVWFSSNQNYETTAFSSSQTKAEHIETSGLCRFGINSEDQRLINWKKYSNELPSPDSVCLHERVGIKNGACPSQWFVSREEIFLSDLTFQVYKTDIWIDLNINDVATEWQRQSSEQARQLSQK